MKRSIFFYLMLLMLTAINGCNVSNKTAAPAPVREVSGETEPEKQEQRSFLQNNHGQIIDSAGVLDQGQAEIILSYMEEYYQTLACKRIPSDAERYTAF